MDSTGLLIHGAAPGWGFRGYDYEDFHGRMVARTVSVGAPEVTAKVVVLGALIALVAKGSVWWLPVAIIAVREVAMSVYRSVVGRHGVSIPARNSAKLKTLLQDVAIGMCLAPPLATHHGVLSAAIWVATAMTVFTGGQYFLDGRRAAQRSRRGGGTAAQPLDGSSSAA